MTGLLSIVAAYLLGAIPFGYLLAKHVKGLDVRSLGSGSIGATNVTRALGPGWGLATLALDSGKGYLAVGLAAWLIDPAAWMAAAGVAAVVGHSYPVFLRFRGGKSVATAGGVFAYFTPLALLAALGVWALVVGLWRYISLGSVLAAAAYPLFAYALYQTGGEVNLAAVVCACLIILRHRSNLQRLIQGTEPRLELRRRS
ncbi:MAG: glycerol-3-phosphate 1-O-acyltransferase PlsY [Acidobacteria bacterium]|nr:glycerol-3-phosphate 1-O-acyltransferase PlsY [Acidobacteriota bacterium]